MDQACSGIQDTVTSLEGFLGERILLSDVTHAVLQEQDENGNEMRTFVAKILRLDEHVCQWEAVPSTFH